MFLMEWMRKEGARRMMLRSADAAKRRGTCFRPKYSFIEGGKRGEMYDTTLYSTAYKALLEWGKHEHRSYAILNELHTAMVTGERIAIQLCYEPRSL
jgi:hypothetical protein